MKVSYTISKIDNINPHNFGITLKSAKVCIKNICNILLSMPEIKKSPIFKKDISKIRFDVSFCNNETIHAINKEYRNKDYATDVITFSLFCDDENSIVYRKTADLGTVIISLEKCQEQMQSSFKKELNTLITHGILHLLGFDHLTKKDYDFVVRIQNALIKELGE